jgi:hypothetical protein
MMPRYMFTQGQNAIGQIVMKCANSGVILNSDLCDLQKRVKSKTREQSHVSLLDKNLEMIQPFVQELWHFLCFRFWPPGGQTKNQNGPKFSL